MLRRLGRLRITRSDAPNPPAVKRSSDFTPRITRRTINPYKELISDLQKKYGKYSYLFEEVEDSLKKYDDKYDKHQQILFHGYHRGALIPSIPNTATYFVAPNATVAGFVMLHQYVSIWYGCVIRGDSKPVKIGQYSNIQENTVIQDYYKPVGIDNDGSTIIGAHVTIGHSCKIRAATVSPFCFVGANSVLMEDSYMDTGSHLGAGSVLYPGQRVPHGELWIGNPAKFVRILSEDEIGHAKSHADYYWRLGTLHAEEFYLSEMLHYELEKRGIPIAVQANYADRPW